jgi:hypothetical protein
MHRIPEVGSFQRTNDTPKWITASRHPHNLPIRTLGRMLRRATDNDGAPYGQVVIAPPGDLRLTAALERARIQPFSSGEALLAVRHNTSDCRVPS